MAGTGGKGSIPAGAGETVHIGVFCQAFEVDPRGCGGDSRTASRLGRNRGRSPRVRGRPRGTVVPLRRRRSIPAGAGETMLLPPGAGPVQVDPRGCGGDMIMRYESCALPGRSPRVRGRRAWLRAGPGPGRSIPAGAGETIASAFFFSSIRVDPRGCGGDISA